jgi:F0F1-type ATP synthase gamma subunit
VQTEQRYRELTAMGLNVKLVLIGAKGIQYFKRRPQYTIQSESPAQVAARRASEQRPGGSGRAGGAAAGAGAV